MGKLSSAEVLGLRATSAVSRDRCVRRSVQDDGCAEGLKHIRPGVRKTRKIEKVTGSERSASRIYREQRAYGAESKDPGDANWQMLLGVFRPRTAKEVKGSQPPRTWIRVQPLEPL